ESPMSTARAHWVELPISLELTGAAYTVRLRLGSDQVPVELIIDTGSSSLAVLPTAYQGERDASLQASDLAQQLSYGQGAWTGPVVCSDLRLDHSGHHLANTQLAVIEAETTDFRGADGIIGLAYHSLDPAHVVSALLPAPASQSWPWPFDSSQSQSAEFSRQLQAQPRVELTPPFTALEEHGVVSNRFSLLIRRALKRALPQARRHPENQGRLLLGGGHELAHLHDGVVVSIPVVHDRYYNVVLQSLQVGEQSPLPAPALRSSELRSYASNAIIDTGSSFILLEDSLYQGMLDRLAQIDPRLLSAIEAFGNTLKNQSGLVDATLESLPWPELKFHFRGVDGATATLVLSPAHYWQHDGLRVGESWFMLLRQLPDWPRQSVLGLPLMCDQMVVFDRQEKGEGVIHFAAARLPDGA
ncbi:MAG: A1 family peptidase, partial [Xanthomonadales bacterium]|nr:A1 family peptidase [Xanthomonadales bacterium]